MLLQQGHMGLVDTWFLTERNMLFLRNICIFMDMTNWAYTLHTAQFAMHPYSI